MNYGGRGDRDAAKALAEDVRWSARSVVVNEKTFAAFYYPTCRMWIFFSCACPAGVQRIVQTAPTGMRRRVTGNAGRTGPPHRGMRTGRRNRRFGDPMKSHEGSHA